MGHSKCSISNHLSMCLMHEGSQAHNARLETMGCFPYTPIHTFMSHVIYDMPQTRVCYPNIVIFHASLWRYIDVHKSDFVESYLQPSNTRHSRRKSEAALQRKTRSNMYEVGQIVLNFFQHALHMSF